MYQPPPATPHPPILWPAQVLFALGIGFLAWSLLVPWSHPVPGAIRGIQTLPGQILLPGLGGLLATWLISHHRPIGRSWWRRLGLAGMLILLPLLQWGIHWNAIRDGRATPVLIWGAILSTAALSLHGWSLMAAVQSTTHITDMAGRSRVLFDDGGLDSVTLFIVSVVVLSISALVVLSVFRPLPVGPFCCK